MTDADYADNVALIANTPTQAESQLHWLEQAVRSIGLYVNVNKTEYMSFKRKGNITALSSNPIMG